MNDKHSKYRRHYAQLVPWITMFFVACSDLTAPFGPLFVSFTVEPNAVQAGDSLLAVLTISNPTRDTVTLFSGSSCVNTLRVLRDGELVTMRGANFGCLDVGTQFPIPPGGSLVRSYHLVAMLQEETQPFDYVVPPPAGAYAVRALMQIGLDDVDAGFWLSP